MFLLCKSVTRVFAQAEIGDRAIEPLYPSFFTASGALQVLTEPRYSQLKQALIDALNERALRPPVARALMQSDAWAAYDTLFERNNLGTSNDKQIGEESPVYLAVAGNDYGFATSSSPEGSPVIIRLRTRCAQCHGESLAHLMTFSVHDFSPLPPVTVFKPGKNERALFVAGRKQDRDDFKSLQQQMIP